MFWLWLSLSASCLEGLVLSASKKKLFFVYRKIFQLVDPVQHQYVFSKGLLDEFCQLQLFPAEIYLFFRHWNFKINATSRTHASCVSSQLAAFADIFGVREEFFCPAFFRLNLVPVLNCIESISWAMYVHLKTLNLKCLEATRNWYHISPIWQVFSPGEEIVNWFDLWWRQNSATTVEHETEWSCYSLPILLACRALHHPYPRAFCTLPSFARIKRTR